MTQVTLPIVKGQSGTPEFGYDPQDDMQKVKSVQKKFRDSFSGAALDLTKWDQVLGTGGTIAVANSTLTFGSGNTANAEHSILSKETFTIPFRVGIGLTLSQRIANQSFFVEAVSVDPSTGVPDGKHKVGWLFDGTSATQAKYETQNGGFTVLQSAASAVVTTAGGGFYEIEPFSDETWWHSTILDSGSGRINSYRRHQQTPDPNAVFKLRLRWLNAGTAPASSTNAVVQFLSVIDYAELTAEITAGRGQAAAGQGIAAIIPALPALIAGTALIGDVSHQYRPGNTGAATNHHVVSAATTNAAVVKASAGKVVGWNLSNTTASWRYVKLHNIATAPTAGSGVVMTIAIPPNSTVTRTIEGGISFATGIGRTVVTGAADTDVTATAVNDVVGDIQFA